MHIYELEALIFADIQVFNKIYNTEFSFSGNSMEIIKPKEKLNEISSQFTVSNNPEIFNEISFEKALKCKYFGLFINRFDKRIKNIKTN